MGLKGYVTNIPARLMDAGEVVSSYHELWHVEASLSVFNGLCKPLWKD